ncbi:MAG: hypothetical protein LBN18_01265, partial [Dysgonamonadaceae bacterium]|nr:hypothetical protein [Dysgonamonadaceae bacterium]
MKSFSELKKQLKQDFSGKKPVRIAVLGDTATQFFVQALRGVGYDLNFDFRIFEADFNQIERQVFDTQSELYEHKPEVVILFQSTHKLLTRYNKLPEAQQTQLAALRIDEIKALTATIQTHLQAKILYFNYPEIDDSVFGNYAAQTELSFVFQTRKLNDELQLFAASQTNFYLCDLAAIQNKIGRDTLFQPSIYVNTEMVLSVDALPLVAQRTADTIAALYGKFKKCLILDLDNTVWGGVIGDDGLENIQLGSLGIGK